MTDVVRKILFWIVSGIGVVLLGFFVKEPLRRWLERRQELMHDTKPRMEIRFHQLDHPKNANPDVAQVAIAQNSRQELFVFHVSDADLTLSPKQLRALSKNEGKKAFIEAIGQIIAESQGRHWAGADGTLADGCFKGPRDLVVTNLPIPGNYYGWNTVDRRLLVISTASVEQFFTEGEGVPIRAFVGVMLKRMAVFSSVSELDPSAVHSVTSIGCLFDFAIQLKRVKDVVARPYICPSCQRVIAECCGTVFASNTKKWIDASV
jgi:hypothetical protein